ncbi:MAG: ABC transporter permease [Acidimicrobiales bacterium]
MTTIPIATSEPRSTLNANRGAPFPVATLTITARAVKKSIRTPSIMLGGTVSGVMFLLIFRYVFGGAVAHLGGLSYVDFVAPGFIVTSVLFGAMAAGTGVAEDLQAGLVDRLRSLPVRAASIVTGRVIGDTLLTSWGLVVTSAVAFAVGFRVHGGIGPAIGALGLSVLYAFAFCWLFAALGFFAGSAQGAQQLAFLVFPLSFVSSAYVPVSTMPGWMQAFANHQPVTAMVDTARILAEGHAVATALGHGLGYYLPASLAWTAGMTVLCIPVALWRLQRS